MHSYAAATKPRIPRTLSAYLLVLGAVSSAHAQTKKSDAALAESLFRHGRTLMTEGKLDEACAKLAESQRLEEKLGTLLNLAICHERQGKTATAWAEFTRAVAQAQNARQPDREALASRHLTALEQSLSKVVITWDEPAPDQTLSLDGVELGAGTIGTALPVDPGDHTLEATAPGRKPWRLELHAAPGPNSQQLVVPKLEEDASAAVEVPASATEERLPAANEPPPIALSTQPESAAKLTLKSAPPAVDDRGGRRAATWITAGVSLAGIAVGSYFGLRAFAIKEDADKECHGTACSQAGLDLHEQVSDTALVSTVAFAVGLAAGGVCVYLLLTDEQRSSARVAYVSAQGSW